MTRIRRRVRARGDRGAAAVEFALIAPVLFLLIFGIIEFGWAEAQQLNVRHGARETARLAAVNYRANTTSTGSTQSAEIVAEACDRMDVQNGARVSLALPSGSASGDEIEVTVSAPLNTLTGYMDFALGGKTITSTVTSRLERAATFSAVTNQACP